MSGSTWPNPYHTGIAESGAGTLRVTPASRASFDGDAARIGKISLVVTLVTCCADPVSGSAKTNALAQLLFKTSFPRDLRSLITSLITAAPRRPRHAGIAPFPARLPLWSLG